MLISVKPACNDRLAEQEGAACRRTVSDQTDKLIIAQHDKVIDALENLTFYKYNDIKEGFHRKMKLIKRRA